MVSATPILQLAGISEIDTSLTNALNQADKNKKDAVQSLRTASRTHATRFRTLARNINSISLNDLQGRIDEVVNTIKNSVKISNKLRSFNAPDDLLGMLDNLVDSLVREYKLITSRVQGDLKSYTEITKTDIKQLTAQIITSRNPTNTIKPQNSVNSTVSRAISSAPTPTSAPRISARTLALTNMSRAIGANSPAAPRAGIAPTFNKSGVMMAPNGSFQQLSLQRSYMNFERQKYREQTIFWDKFENGLDKRLDEMIKLLGGNGGGGLGGHGGGGLLSDIAGLAGLGLGAAGLKKLYDKMRGKPTTAQERVSAPEREPIRDSRGGRNGPMSSEAEVERFLRDSNPEMRYRGPSNSRPSYSPRNINTLKGHPSFMNRPRGNPVASFGRGARNIANNARDFLSKRPAGAGGFSSSLTTGNLGLTGLMGLSTGWNMGNTGRDMGLSPGTVKRGDYGTHFAGDILWWMPGTAQSIMNLGGGTSFQGGTVSRILKAYKDRLNAPKEYGKAQNIANRLMRGESVSRAEIGNDPEFINAIRGELKSNVDRQNIWAVGANLGIGKGLESAYAPRSIMGVRLKGSNFSRITSGLSQMADMASGELERIKSGGSSTGSIKIPLPPDLRDAIGSQKNQYISSIRGAGRSATSGFGSAIPAGGSGIRPSRPYSANPIHPGTFMGSDWKPQNKPATPASSSLPPPSGGVFIGADYKKPAATPSHNFSSIQQSMSPDEIDAFNADQINRRETIGQLYVNSGLITPKNTLDLFKSQIKNNVNTEFSGTSNSGRPATPLVVHPGNNPLLHDTSFDDGASSFQGNNGVQTMGATNVAVVATGTAQIQLNERSAKLLSDALIATLMQLIGVRSRRRGFFGGSDGEGVGIINASLGGGGGLTPGELSSGGSLSGGGGGGGGRNGGGGGGNSDSGGGATPSPSPFSLGFGNSSSNTSKASLGTIGGQDKFGSFGATPDSFSGTDTGSNIGNIGGAGGSAGNRFKSSTYSFGPGGSYSGGSFGGGGAYYPSTGGTFNGKGYGNTRSESERQTYDFWKSKGLAPHQLAAMMGNLGAESEFRPGIVNGIGATGIAQWTSSGGRKERMLAYAKSQGVDIFDRNTPTADKIRVQNEFFHKELTTPGTLENKAWKRFLDSKTPEEAQNAIAGAERWKGWEQGKSGIEAGNHYKYTDQYAQRIAKGEFDSTSNTATPDNPSSSSGRVVAYGDSHAKGLAKALGAVDMGVKGAGFGNKQLPSTEGIRPGDKVLVSIGTNDARGLTSDKAIANYKAKIQDRIAEIQKRGGQPVIMGVAPPEKGQYSDKAQVEGSAKMNTALKEVSQSIGVPFHDVNTDSDLKRASDGLHYQSDSYKAMGTAALGQLGSSGSSATVPASASAGKDPLKWSARAGAGSGTTVGDSGDSTGTGNPTGAVIPATGTFMSPFLRDRTGNRSHAGIDISGDRGSPIMAAVGGKVLRNGVNSGYGYNVDILGSDGYVYRYAHLDSKPDVKVGQTISTGETFAQMGASGTSNPNAGFHLHFERRSYDSYKANPYARPDANKNVPEGLEDPAKFLHLGPRWSKMQGGNPVLDGTATAAPTQEELDANKKSASFAMFKASPFGDTRHNAHGTLKSDSDSSTSSNWEIPGSREYWKGKLQEATLSGNQSDIKLAVKNLLPYATAEDRRQFGINSDGSYSSNGKLYDAQGNIQRNVTGGYYANQLGSSYTGLGTNYTGSGNEIPKLYDSAKNSVNPFGGIGSATGVASTPTPPSSSSASATAAPADPTPNPPSPAAATPPPAAPTPKDDDNSGGGGSNSGGGSNDKIQATNVTPPNNQMVMNHDDFGMAILNTPRLV